MNIDKPDSDSHTQTQSTIKDIKTDQYAIPQRSESSYKVDREIPSKVTVDMKSSSKQIQNS